MKIEITRDQAALIVGCLMIGIRENKYIGIENELNIIKEMFESLLIYGGGSGREMEEKD